MLKNIGATFSPIHIPPVFLLGIKGISSPICQRTELVADFLEEPVPITSPTRVTGNPVFFNFSISSRGLSVRPSLGILYIDKACKGMSGLDHASGAGERSSVFVSPGTLKTTVSIFSGTSGFERNQSAAAQDSMTFFAFTEVEDFSARSLKASKTNKVFDKAFTASSPHSLSSSNPIKGSTL